MNMVWHKTTLQKPWNHNELPVGVPVASGFLFSASPIVSKQLGDITQLVYNPNQEMLVKPSEIHTEIQK